MAATASKGEVSMNTAGGELSVGDRVQVSRYLGLSRGVFEAQLVRIGPGRVRVEPRLRNRSEPL